MGQRVLLQEVLETICDHVYFQPPANVEMEYPAIVYNREPIDTRFADNAPYILTDHYELTLITRNPDDARVKALASLPQCRHDRFFVSDNLNHDVFTIYF